VNRIARPMKSQKGHAVLTRAEALEIVTRAILEINSENDADDQVVVYDENTVERDLVFGFFCNTKKFKETRSSRDALLGIGPIIVSRRTGAVAVCGNQHTLLEHLDEYEQRAASGDW
jgi:hypothetical protein